MRRYTRPRGTFWDITRGGPYDARALWVWTPGVAILFLFVSKSTSAIGPAAILLHGGELQTPIVVRPAIGSFIFMWGGGTRDDKQSEPQFRPALMVAVT